MPRLRLLAVATALVALAAPLAACSNAPERTAGDGEITVYSGRSETFVAPILEQFTADTGIRVTARYGDSADLAAQIIEEGDRTPADVYFGQDAGALGALDNEQRLGALPSSVLDAVPAEYRSTGGTWTGVTARARVIVYDGDALSADEVPDSVLELTEPQWKGKVAIAPTNASFQSFVTALRLTEGDEKAKEWLEGIQANGAQRFERNGLILDAVDQGRVQIGLINHYYWYEKAQEVGRDKMRAQVKYTRDGDPGSLVNVAGAGVLVGSVDDPDAQRFVAYLLEKKTQQDLVDRTSEYPLVDGVRVPEGLRPLRSLQGPDVALADLAALPATLAMLDEVGLT